MNPIGGIDEFDRIWQFLRQSMRLKEGYLRIGLQKLSKEQ
jgi:hypothetical protein